MREGVHRKVCVGEMVTEQLPEDPSIHVERQATRTHSCEDILLNVCEQCPVSSQKPEEVAK